MTNSIELMTEKFSTLPADAQAAIRQFEYDRALKAIHAKYKLHIDQAASLEKALAGIIFGDDRPLSLVQKLQHDLRIDQELAKNITSDVNTTILKPIQDAMRRMQAEEV
jgi:hypothetical protein